MKRAYSKSDCFALVEFLDALWQYNQSTIDDICKVINCDTDKMIERLSQLASDIDNVITVDKKNVPDNYSWATIMKLVHIPDSKQDR